MKWKSTRRVLAIFTTWALTSACNVRQPSPDWNGTWKLNPSKGNFRGPVFNISISANGEYRFSSSGKADITFRCDGKDRLFGKDRTRACVKGSDTMLNLTLKENGVKTTVTHWELPPDGGTLLWTTTTFRPSGPAITDHFVAARISGHNDFAGQWRNMDYLQQHADLTVRLDSQTLHIAYPSAGQYVDAPFDGADAPVLGPHGGEGLTYSAHLVGRREVSILSKRNGKALNQDSLELSGNGKTLTESWWNPDHPTDKGTLVYEKK